MCLAHSCTEKLGLWSEDDTLFVYKIGLLDLIQQTKLILLQHFFYGKKTILQHVNDPYYGIKITGD